MCEFFAESALILAGGAGRRMGCDKKELVLNGEKIIDTLIKRLSAHFEEIIVSSNTRFERKNVIIAADTLGKGPLAGIYSALSICKSEYLFVTACDMPFVSDEYITRIKKIVSSRRPEALAARRADGFFEPFNAFYFKGSLEKIEENLKTGAYKMSALFQKLNTLHLDGFNERIFFNINCPADLDQAAAGAGKTPSPGA